MKILFVNHSCSRTGAPMIILYLMKWLKLNHPEIIVDVVSLSGGELVGDFTSNSRNHYFHHGKKNLFTRFSYYFLRKIKIMRFNEDMLYNHEIKKISSNKYDIIYNNTIIGLLTSSAIKKRLKKSKLICHVHELQITIKHYNKEFSENTDNIDQFITASDLVKRNLVQNWNIEEGKIKTVYEFSNFKNINFKKKENKIFKIGGAGQVSWRKGVELFIQVGMYLKKVKPDFIFEMEWMGYISEHDKSIYTEDIRKIGLDNKIFFSGVTNKPSEFFQQIDIFLMTSREDPFPLVCIEAANYGIPIICFNKATGTQEFLNDIDLSIVDYLDTHQMAENIITLQKDSGLYNKTSQQLKDRFKRLTPAYQCPLIYQIIDSIKN